MPELPAFMSEQLSRISLVAPGKVRVGLVGFLRRVFDVNEGIAQFQTLVEILRINPLIELVVESEVSVSGILWAGELKKTDAVASYFVQKRVDVVLIVAVNYGDEEGAATLAKKIFAALRCPIYTFVFPDLPIKPDGKRVLDDNCGILPLRQNMRRALKMTPGYIPISAPDSTVFDNGLMAMLRVASGLRSLRSVRGIQIGAAQQTFPAIEGDRQNLRDLFDLRVETTDAGAFRAKIKDGLANPPAWLAEVEEWAYQWINTDAIIGAYPNVRKMTALALGIILQTLAEKESNAVSINCWPEIQQELGLMVCGVNGLLFSLGVVAACETDWPGNLACACLQGLALGDTGVAFFADLTRFEKPDQRAMWWHCGPFAPQRCRGGKCSQGPGWIFKGVDCAGLLDGKWGELGQRATFIQLRPDEADRLTLVATDGSIVDGPPTIGTHFYTRVPKPDEFEAFMMSRPFDHHNSGWLTAGMTGPNYLNLVDELAYWAGVRMSQFSNLESA